MSVLKLEIEQYLLKNNFYLYQEKSFDSPMFIYKSNIFNWFNIYVVDKEKHNVVTCRFESKSNDYKKLHARGIVLKSLDEFKFLATHCLSSPLFDKSLIL